MNEIKINKTETETIIKFDEPLENRQITKVLELLKNEFGLKKKRGKGFLGLTKRK